MTANDTINLLPPDEKAEAEKLLERSRSNNTPKDLEYTQPSNGFGVGSDNFANSTVKNIAVNSPVASVSPKNNSASMPEDMDIDGGLSVPEVKVSYNPVSPAVSVAVADPIPVSARPVFTSAPAAPTTPVNNPVSASILDSATPLSFNSPAQNSGNFNVPVNEVMKNLVAEKNNINSNSLSLQAELQSGPREHPLVKVVVWLTLTVVVCGACGGSLLWKLSGLKKNNLNLENQIKNTESSIAQMGEVKTKIQALENKVNRAQELLKKHIYPTNILAYLENYTLAGTAYAGLSIENGKDLSLKTTTASYESAARQVKLLQMAADFSKEVKISEIKMGNSKDGSRAGFNLTLTLADQVFQFKEKINRPQ